MIMTQTTAESMEIFAYTYRCGACHVDFSFRYDPHVHDQGTVYGDAPRYCPYCGVKTIEVQVQCTLTKY